MATRPSARDAGRNNASASEPLSGSAKLPSADEANDKGVHGASPAPDNQHGDVSEQLAGVVSEWQSWFADLCDLFVAESRLALTLVTAWCVLSLLLVLTLFLALISVIVLVGLILFDLSLLEPVDLAALAFAATLVFSLVIIAFIRSLNNRMFLNATVQQVRSAFSTEPSSDGVTDND